MDTKTQQLALITSFSKARISQKRLGPGFSAYFHLLTSSLAHNRLCSSWRSQVPATCCSTFSTLKMELKKLVITQVLCSVIFSGIWPRIPWKSFVSVSCVTKDHHTVILILPLLATWFCVWLLRKAKSRKSAHCRWMYYLYYPASTQVANV